MSLSEHATLAGIVEMAPGTFHTMLLKQDGSVWSTGVNSNARSESFVRVIPTGAIAAAAGDDYSIVLKQDETVWATGKNAKGQFSFFDGSTSTGRRAFFFVQRIVGAKSIAAGSHHTLILTKPGRVWATGWNKYGQLGDGSTDDRTKFLQVYYKGVKALAVAAGDVHSIILKQGGSVLAMGRNYNGQLGDGSKVDKSYMAKVMSSGAADVAAGGSHSLVVKQDGSVCATGWNQYGQLGDGSTIDRINYVQVVSSSAKKVAAGRRHSMMLKQDGSVWATGYNLYGQLGDGSTSSSNVFVKAIPEAVKGIAAGAFHSMALVQDGGMWVTGSNEYGQFGDGGRTSQKNFVRLTLDDGAGHGMIIYTRSVCIRFLFTV